MWQTIFLPILRHFFGAALGGLGAFLVGKGMDPGEVQNITTNILASMLAGALALYAVGEKVLKPLFRRWFGEVQTGDIPVVTEDQMKAQGKIPS